jgi:glycosyltransferase involved in cell wall biosynthesis
MPVISVITPVWNGLPYLRQAAESALGQEFDDWEWIISDDGSTDGSIQYLLSLQEASDGLVRFFAQSKNLGIFGNLNFLTSQAHSSLIQILCQDDYFTSPDTLACLFAKWKSLPSSIGASRWNSSSLDCAVGLGERIDPLSSQLLFFLNGNIPGNLSNVAFRKAAWINVGPFDQRFPYAGDFYYWALFAKSFSIVLLPENGVYIRQHPTQASCLLNKVGELYPQLSEVSSEIYKRIPQKGWLSDFSLRIAGTLVYDCGYRRGLMMRALGRGSARYRSFLRSSSGKAYLVHPFLKWLLMFATLGGALGKKIILSLAYKLNVN